MDFTLSPRWHLSPKEAVAFQRELAAHVSLQDSIGAVRLVAGVDLAVGRGDELGRGAVVVWRPEDGEVVESIAVEMPLTLPYIPGLLAFREGPLAEQALRQLRSEPDVLLFDGQGLAHPRRCGIACHLGVLLNRPTVGVGKTRLIGHAEEPGAEPGERTPLFAPEGDQIGVLLRTKLRVKPVYVSPGHLVSFDRAAEIVMACVRGRRLPEPVFLADQLSKDRGR